MADEIFSMPRFFFSPSADVLYLQQQEQNKKNIKNLKLRNNNTIFKIL